MRRKNDYALLDYSIPVVSYNQDGSVRAYYPFVGKMTDSEFESFITYGDLKTFGNYEYNDNQKSPLNSQRAYAVGSFEVQKHSTESSEIKK